MWGDSMINARIHNGDIVFVRKQSTVENGDIAVVIIDDEATLKRVYIKPHSLVLMPENTSYEPIVVNPTEHNEIRILGKAIAFQSDIR
jgi:repressor LexA